MNKTIFIAAMLAVATILTAGLTVLPSSVQEAQANPCSVNSEGTGGDAEGEGATGGAATSPVTNSGDQNCKFIGNIDID